MKIIALLSLLLTAAFGIRQDPTTPATGSSGADSEAVLSEMDRSASGFKSATAVFEWDNYQKAVDETDKQAGKVYFRRNGPDAEAMFDITEPNPKQVLFKGGTLSLYDKKINQVTEHKTANKGDVEAFLGLGFGARGHDLPKNYDIKMDGWETVDGTRVAKLELVAKSEKVRNMFSKFILWIDPKQDVPLKQQVLEPNGDYWISHYTRFKLNSRISEDVFHLKTDSGTKIVRQ